VAIVASFDVLDLDGNPAELCVIVATNLDRELTEQKPRELLHDRDVTSSTVQALRDRQRQRQRRREAEAGAEARIAAEWANFLAPQTGSGKRKSALDNRMGL
jgi:hypothetical protein